MQQIFTLGQLIHVNAQHAPQSPCIVSASGDVLTWERLFAQLERTHTALRALGLGPNARIAVALGNGPTLAAAFLTVAASAACAPLNPSYSADEFEFFLSDLKAQALIASPDVAAPAIDAATRLGIPVFELETDDSAPGLFRLKGHTFGKKNIWPASAPEIVTSDSVALFLHTSGTTAKPKLVPLRQRNLIASARNMVETLQLSASDRCLNLMPLFHIHGLVGGLLAPLAAGGSAVCPPSLRPGEFFRWMETTRPSWYTAVPTMHRAIVTEAMEHKAIIQNCPLRFIRSSSASLPAALFNELTQIFGAPVLEAYSMTEAAHQMTCNPLAAGKQKIGTVGIAAGPEVALMDETGGFVPPGTPGEVVIRGPSVMSGYEANPGANAEAFVNGWFRTGDQGRFDSDGYLELTGRLKEQINRGGEKISPLEVDQVLLRHPHVSEAATFGFPHPTLGEEIAAVVVLRAKSSAVPSPGPAELQTFLRESLAPFKIPRRILVLDRIPKGPTGKVQRRQLSTILGMDATKPRHERAGSQEQLSALETQLLDLWRRTLNHDSIGLDDDFFEMGGDSILAVVMLLELQRSVGHDVPETLLFENGTIRQLARALTELDLSHTTPLIHVQAKGTRPPFFFFHGDYEGHGYYTRRLARLLGADQPFISVPPHGLAHDPVPPSVEQMAAERLPLLLAAQPQGPFRLGGYCNGGIVALEIAQKLIAAGRRVDLVVLIDTPMLNLRPSVRIVHQSAVNMLRMLGAREETHPRIASAMDVVWRQLSNLEQTSFANYWAEFRRGSQRFLAEHFGRAGAPAGGELPAKSPQTELREDLARQERSLARAYNRLFRHYYPKQMGVPIVYFSAEYNGGQLHNLGPHVELIHLPGGHWGCITTDVEVLAGHLRRRLDTLNPPIELEARTYDQQCRA